MNLAQYTLYSPLWLLALAAIPLVLWLRRRRRTTALVVPFAAAWSRSKTAAPSRLPLVFAVAGAALLVFALARPQRVDVRHTVTGEGYDLMLAIDLSPSMLAEDYGTENARQSRLDVIKPVIAAFIGERPSDRIGVAVFAGNAYTLSPLTFDHAWLAKQIGRMTTDIVGNGTAIGDGLGVALARLEQRERGTAGDSAGASKRLGAFVILLTDGANNTGSLAPEQAAALAKARGIPIYAIGVGKNGMVPMPVFDRSGRKLGYRPMRSDLDEGALRRIAEETGGKFFRADATDTVRKAFEAIGAARKIKFQRNSRTEVSELFAPFAGTALALLAFAAILVVIRRRRRR